ncbi:MAG: hypothetical protein HKN28_19985 [Alphaproteobacteria bacterium]|nr:hypothetical protein [Alphaproteobacteria bacterium]
MKRRSFISLLMAALVGLRTAFVPRPAAASSESDDDLLLVNGWIVRRSQVSKSNPEQLR